MFTSTLITCCKQTPFNKSPAGQKLLSILRGYLRKFSFPCRKHPTILQQKWANFKTDVRKNNLEIALIQPNGYYFLNSILTCLLRDYGNTLTLEDCITKIVTHLCRNHRKYSAFHQTSCTEYAADQLISDALDFFHNGQFFANVVDLLMQITVNVLNLELFIYQRNGDLIQVLHFTQERQKTVNFYGLFSTYLNWQFHIHVKNNRNSFTAVQVDIQCIYSIDNINKNIA